MPDSVRKIFKAGEQSAADPLEFVMSTASVDRMGDVVEQDWDLSEFRSNPIALFNHDSNAPIGTWENVKVVGGKLVGRLRLAAKGTSALVDSLRALVEQRILKAVSVGFVPAKAVPIKGGGYRLSGNRLFECSLVSVPANAEALAVTRSLDPALAGRLFRASADRSLLSAAAQLAQSRASDLAHTPGAKTMKTSERLENRQADMARLQDELDTLRTKMDDGELTDDEIADIDRIAAEIKRAERDIQVLKKIEAAEAVKAQSAGPAPRIEVRHNGDPKHRIGATLHCVVRGHHDHKHPVDVARELYRDEPDVQILVKAAVDPALTGTEGWAAELVQSTWGDFLDALRDVSVYPRAPGGRFGFGRYGTVTIPRNNGAGNLAGGFVAEGAPIPVKAGAYDNVSLAPKKMAVITTASREMLRRSIPALEALLRDQLLQDTAAVLDAKFLDNAARTAVRPAGLQDTTETGAGNINAAAGTGTVANVITDISGVVSRLNALNMGMSGAWLMNRIRAFNLGMKQDAASGEFPFRAEVAAGTLAGFPIILSNNVPSAVVYFIESGAMQHGMGDGPQMEMSNTATLHMEDTSPQDIVYDDTGATPALPSKSMFQIDSAALRLIYELDWRIVRTGGVQVLTSVAW